MSVVDVILRIPNIIVDVIRKREKGVAENSRESFDKWQRKTNPKDNFGNISRCAVCQSIYHQAKQCSDKHREGDDNIKVTLFSKEIHDCYITKFVGETMNGAVLNSGRTQNVCGLSWLNIYLESLTDNEKSKVIENEVIKRQVWRWKIV